MNLIVHILALCGNAHELLMTLLSTVYPFVCVPANIHIGTEYSLKDKIFRGTPRHGIGLFPILPAQLAVFGFSFIELTLYTWLTPSSSSATITRLCQEVPVLSVQTLPMLRGTRQGLGFFSCALMRSLRLSFVMRRKSATSTSCSIVNIVLFPESSRAE